MPDRVLDGLTESVPEVETECVFDRLLSFEDDRDCDPFEPETLTVEEKDRDAVLVSSGESVAENEREKEIVNSAEELREPESADIETSCELESDIDQVKEPE